MNISEFDKEFRRILLLHGSDKSTVKTYGNCILVFLGFYSKKHDSPLKIPSKDIEDYVIHLINDGYSASYINQFIISVKHFYRINKQPKKCDKLIYHERNIKTPNILTYNECMDMCNSNIFIKHKAVINLLYYGALRRGELINLKIEHISKDRRISIIDSKQGKSRVITIPLKTIQLLREYYIKFKPKEYLFNGEGKKMMYSERSIGNIIKNTAKLCKINKRVYPHIMRSSRATHLLDNGASDMYVSEFLGHSKLQTTKDYYCKLTIKGMQDNFDAVDEKMKLNS